MKKLASLFLVFFVAACAYDPVPQRMTVADSIASKNNLERSVIDTSGFSIMSYKRITSGDKPLNVYIEGDGFAWASHGRLSVNPTPKNPVALKLASLDKSQNVVYLARPCQYVDFEKNGLCKPKYWHGSKYSNLVIDSLSKAIDVIKSENNLEKINLIGFSGGGGVVAILGAVRNDVLSVRTVAGNLDHVAFNNHHGVSQLNDSLNAVDFVSGLKNIPQMHISGSNDKVVPPFIAEDFAKKTDSTNGCVDVRMLPGVTHHKGWEKYWNELITKPLECINKNNG